MVKTWQVVLATMAIFVAGIVAGGATALGLVRWVATHPGAAPVVMNRLGLRPAGGQLPFGPQLMKSFAGQLNLTDEQREKIAPIVKRTVAQLGRERREVQLTSALAIEKMQDEIADILTPEQRSKFEELIARQRARLNQFQQSAPKPPQPGTPPALQETPK